MPDRKSTRPAPPRVPRPRITARIAAELIAHEGIVREAYRDSVGVWTWSVGITDASGHRVSRYRDNPQTLERCLEVYLWLLRERYLPPVVAAFGAHGPSEHELGAALSFHWNTGAIARAEWMRAFRDGRREDARALILNWCRPAALAPRRRLESALFFDARWSGDGHAHLYAVAKPSYRPRGARQVNILPTLERLLGETKAGPAPPDEPAAGGARCDWFTRLSRAVGLRRESGQEI